MAKVSMKARTEVIERHKSAYKRGKKKEKTKLLDIVCAGTGLSRDRAARLLSGKSGTAGTRKTKGKRGRKRTYDDKFRRALEDLWHIMGFVCGRRLAAGMEDLLDALERAGEAEYDDDIKDKLRKASASTMDRLLTRARKGLQGKGRATTKPGTLLKRNIPIRMGTQWDDAIPGFVEIDLVAHCGETTAGDYANTLDVTDISSCWTETRAVANKAQRNVFAGLMHIKEQLPFPLRGIDSDNGSEFINDQLYRYCKQENIVFTRGRPYTKNDGCHAEQKNWSIVRQHIGYDRYEGEAAVKLLNEYYDALRLYTNFFQPSAKLLRKERVGARVKKHYEAPRTPYRRSLASKHINDEAKAKLTETFITLNPVKLLRDMSVLQDKLRTVGMPYRGYDGVRRSVFVEVSAKEGV
jgi:hypothetical protein